MISDIDAKRELRGRRYQLQQRVKRLTGAWPDPAKRDLAQQRSIDEAETMLAMVERTMTDEGWI